MSVEAFLDTNVLIYAVSSDPSEAPKKEKALDLIEHSEFGLSAQVLQEFYVTVTRKIALPLSPDDACRAPIEQFRCFPVIWTDYPLIIAGNRDLTPLRDLVLGRRNHRRRRTCSAPPPSTPRTSIHGQQLPGLSPGREPIPTLRSRHRAQVFSVIPSEQLLA